MIDITSKDVLKVTHGDAYNTQVSVNKNFFYRDIFSFSRTLPFENKYIL